MLIIRVKHGEPIFIGDAKVIIEHDTTRFKVGIDAPRDIIVERESVRQERLLRGVKYRKQRGGS